jgi:hypothetical protein
VTAQISNSIFLDSKSRLMSKTSLATFTDCVFDFTPTNYSTLVGCSTNFQGATKRENRKCFLHSIEVTFPKKG